MAVQRRGICEVVGGFAMSLPNRYSSALGEDEDIFVSNHLHKYQCWWFVPDFITKLKFKNMNNSEQSAFPLQPTFNSEGQICNERYEYEGLSKREYFAAKAMQAILSNPSHSEEYKVNDWGIDGKRIAQNALHCADELLFALEQPVVSNQTDWHVPVQRNYF